MAALAPMPSASVRMTVTASPLARSSERTANLRSVRKLMAVTRLSPLPACQALEFFVVQQRFEIAVSRNLALVSGVDLDRLRDRRERLGLPARFHVDVGER